MIAALREHAAVVRYFNGSPALHAPTLVVWVATLGSALHSPVIAFFYLGLGLKPTEIGMLASISSCGSLLAAPAYGHLLDTRGPWLAILLSSAMCALGCLLRGLAQSWAWLLTAAVLLGLGGANLSSLVLAHVVGESPREQRPLMIASYMAQLSALAILGKALYVPWDASLQAVGVGAEMTRCAL